jgi:hypothetical protein
MQLQSYLSLQPESPRLSSLLPRPTLIAHWEIENSKLVCYWVVDDRPTNSSD